MPRRASPRSSSSPTSRPASRWSVRWLSWRRWRPTPGSARIRPPPDAALAPSGRLAHDTSVMAWLRPIARSPLGLLLLVAVAAVVVQGGSVPHTHAGIAPGFYNQDHDGSLLATLHGMATVSA